MKQRLLTWGLAALLATGVAVAQMGHHEGVGGPRGGQQSRLDYLALRLNLTDAQRAQATTIFTTAETASAALQPQLTQARTNLTNAVRTTTTTPTQIDQLAAAYGTLVGQLTAIETKASAAFYALLTTEQRALYDALRGPGGVGGGRR